jgi:hypothetical protein
VARPERSCDQRANWRAVRNFSHGKVKCIWLMSTQGRRAPRAARPDSENHRRAGYGKQCRGRFAAEKRS